MNIENINQSLLTPIKLNWFLSPLTILLTAGGFILLLFRKNENKELIPVLILLFPASVFLWYPLIFPDLMWALRRQLPYGLPLIAILNAYIYSGAWINKKGNSNVVRQGVIVAGLIVLIFIMSNNIGMFKTYQKQRDFQGAIDFISGVNRDLDQGSKSNNVIFIEKRDFEIYNYLATPVSFLSSENDCFVYQKEFDQDFFKEINRIDILNKKNVYLISKRDLSNELFTDYKIQKVDDYMYKARLWERTMDKPPSGYDYFEVNFSIFRIR